MSYDGRILARVRELIADRKRANEEELTNRRAEVAFRVPAVIEIEKEIELDITDEDIEIVANQGNVSKEEAKEALKEAKGDLAEAILKLSQ